MTWYEPLLFLHILAAFLTVGAVVLFAAVLVSARGASVADDVRPLARMSRLADQLWNIGGTAVLVFGIVLVLYVDGYEILDGWIIGALVLYAVASAAGGFVNQRYKRMLDASGE